MCARRGGCGSVGGSGRYGMGTAGERRVPGPASRGGPVGGGSEGASRGGARRGFTELEGPASGLRLARRVGMAQAVAGMLAAMLHGGVDRSCSLALALCSTAVGSGRLSARPGRTSVGVGVVAADGEEPVIFQRGRKLFLKV